jgi:hypothetical protein
MPVKRRAFPSVVVLDRPPEPLDVNVVEGTAFCVHAQAGQKHSVHVLRLENFCEATRRVLGALVCIEDLIGISAAAARCLDLSIF